MTVTAQHPAFMIIVDLQQAREDIDKAIDLLEAKDTLSASTRVKLATINLAKTANGISVLLAQSKTSINEITTTVKLRPITSGDHMPWEKFVHMAEHDDLDGDTTVDLATRSECSNFSVRWAEIRNGWLPPSWVTHVVVYSK